MAEGHLTRRYLENRHSIYNPSKGTVYPPTYMYARCLQAPRKPGPELLILSEALSMEEVQIKSQVIKADSSLANTLSRLANVRVQVELIQEDAKSLKQGFAEMAKRINVLTASYQEERDIILKRRTKA